VTFDRDREKHILLGRQVLRHEARALEEAADGLGHDFVDAVEMIATNAGRLVTTGVGKSGHAARKIAAMFSSTGTPASFLHAGEGVHGDLGGLRKGDVALVVSHSGETPEITALLPMLKQLELPVIAITDNARSTLALVANITITAGATAAADPIGLAPTSSAATATAIGDAMALAVAQHRGYRLEDFEHHPGGALGKLMKAVYKARAEQA
jgi:arabinose-5-phosphate isomerase